MSMVINLVEDHNIYLCKGGPVYNGGVQPTPPPITYLTQWKIVGNSEVHGNEIWSCGEYNATDGKYHILVQPQGGIIADIALTEPLRKVNDVADTIEFPSDTEGKALVTRNLKSLVITGNEGWDIRKTYNSNDYYISTSSSILVGWKRVSSGLADILCSLYKINTAYGITIGGSGIGFSSALIKIGDDNYKTSDSLNAFKDHINGMELIYELATPTTELVNAPQIAEADSYSCVISQGGKAVSWSEFLYTINYLLTDSENNILVDNENYQLTVQN